MSVNELSACLWRERELLELLTFKLEEEQFLLTAGKTRWLQYATREVEQVMERLRAAGLARTVEVASVAAEWGAHENATLRELVDAAPEGPWAEILGSHLRAMTEQTNQIRELRDLNEHYLRTAIRFVQEAQSDGVTEAGTYDSNGTSAAPAGAARIFDLTL
ncbi:flagellar protein FlgN [Lacisediminihabitans profunda]|uniref:Flagellar protein FlgN n=1 Tax=Lacisediminihabitans profunda TaxID=2594790 RepID=A0A5C8UMS9_9MICO|nr:flagellar protein FlgN [Lacisediminihabitans profunda]TXN29221.1 flagellar protein FlgN [Lacisediminihabitans profunda]